MDICVPQMSRDYDCLSVSEVCLSRTTDYLSHGKNILMTACQYLRHNCPSHQKLTTLQEDSKVGSFFILPALESFCHAMSHEQTNDNVSGKIVNPGGSKALTSEECILTPIRIGVADMPGF